MWDVQRPTWVEQSTIPAQPEAARVLWWYGKCMAEIRFDNEQEFARPSAAEGPRGLTALVLKWGIAKDERNVQYVLLGVVVICILIIGFFIFPSRGPANIPLPPVPPSV
jgi:hypothetical protein